ncbi:hypothetical protein OH76DRAFT_1422648 [Lentinus brumalis]|uniref:Uncharacterized protein n=1 Tax=Lentinus brumalis TaxID=2498619 RepID=A0A371CPI9_9APHY|nr:hypothetical protein OH76DRAFT_1422648 [Polyporus brumalis]
MSHRYQPSGHEDSLIKITDDVTKQAVVVAEPGAFLVDFFSSSDSVIVPSWFPGAGWKREGITYLANMNQMSMGPHQFLTGHPLHNRVASRDEEYSIKVSSASVCLGSTDTTVSAELVDSGDGLVTFRAEKDTLARRSHVDIIAQMTHLNAVYLELLRWNPVPHPCGSDERRSRLMPYPTPGFAHSVADDDFYLEYFNN